MKKEKISTQKLLASIKINLTEFFADLRAVYPDSWRTPSFTKKGSGRYHKQGKEAYVPRQQEYSGYRQIYNADGEFLGYRW